jgi:hypothetical protein
VTEIHKIIILAAVLFGGETASRIKGIKQSKGVREQSADEYNQDKREQIIRG